MKNPERNAAVTGIGDWPDCWASRRPDSVFIRYGDEAITWTDFAKHVRTTIAYLRHLDFEAGDRLACMMENRPEYLSYFWACLKMGVIFCPINTRYSAHEAAVVFSDLEPRATVFSSEFAEVVESPLCAGLHGMALAADGPVTAWDGGQSAPRPEISSSASEVEAESPACILFTSGTTGRPKGAVLTHSNLQAMATNWIATLGITSEDDQLLIVPLCYTAGLTMSVLPIITGGAIEIHAKFTSADVVRSIATGKIAWTCAVPTMLRRILEDSSVRPDTFRALKFCICGGAPVSEELGQAAAANGVQVINGYGSTEGSGGLNICNPPEYLQSTPNSIGMPTPLSRVRIVDNDFKDISEPDTVGELLLAGPLVFSHYWHNPEATKDSFKDGWYRTGDLVSKDSRGLYFTVGRRAEVVISGGLNIYPAEVENVVVGYPGVAEALIFGVPDDQWGERVVCALTLDDSVAAENLSTDDLEAWSRERLAKYKAPKEFIVVEDFPRTASGKPIRKQLHDAYVRRVGADGQG